MGGLAPDRPDDQRDPRSARAGPDLVRGERARDRLGGRLDERSHQARVEIRCGHQPSTRNRDVLRAAVAGCGARGAAPGPHGVDRRSRPAARTREVQPPPGVIAPIAMNPKTATSCTKWMNQAHASPRVSSIDVAIVAALESGAERLGCSRTVLVAVASVCRRQPAMA